MQADLLLDLLKGLLNLPDLVILAVVLICMVLGFRRLLRFAVRLGR